MPVNRKHCKGCHTYENMACSIGASTTKNGIKEMCPCIDCLVKAMCETECQEHMEYRGLVNMELKRKE